MPSLSLPEGVPLNFIEQEIELETEAHYGANVPLSISSALLRRLEETARPCVRMAIEGTSAVAGAPPAWLERASDIRTLGFGERNGRSILHLKAPKLGEAAPELFDQQSLWPGLAGPDDTALQLISNVSYVVRNREAASDVYDQALLRRFTYWKKLFEGKVRQVQLPPGSGTVTSTPVTLDMAVVESARALSAQTPAPRQVRLVGKLDMVRYSTQSFGLLLDNGEEVRGVFQEADPYLLRKHLGEDVTIFGRAIYRPSGTLLRIDAQEILDTTEGRATFSSVPRALSRSIRMERKVQTAKSGVAAFFGTWPGEETDEELLAALGELRH